MSSREVIENVQADLFAIQDLAYRDFQAKLMPTVNKETVIGVRTPSLRAYAKKFGKTDNVSAFLEVLPHKYYEENNLHGLLIEQIKAYPSCIAALDRFLPYIDNWATCDMIALPTVKKHLEQWQYSVHIVSDLSNVIGEFTEYSPHIALMDIKLPFYNGYHWCSEIRKVSKLPIMFLSSASDNMNIVMAMNMGADDFVTKPFDLEVLTVKIQALIRRSYDFSVGNSVISHRDAMLNLTDATVVYKDKKLELTKNELKILQMLMENKEKIVSRDDLMAKIWESDDYIDENTLSVNVNRLRKKLSGIGLDDFIITKKGLGYKLG